jgi:hypothetical protein
MFRFRTRSLTAFTVIAVAIQIAEPAASRFVAIPLQWPPWRSRSAASPRRGRVRMDGLGGDQIARLTTRRT